MSLFSRNDDQPGIHGALRDCTVTGKGFKRFHEGDIAVVDAPDISRNLAQALIDAKAGAVVNVGEFSSGSVPNFGPQLLIDSKITLVSSAGTTLLESFRDGKKGRVAEDGTVYQGSKEIAKGEVMTRENAEARFQDGQQALVDHMEAYFGNTIEFINSESPLLIDGLGIPDTGTPIKGRKALVVSPSVDHREHIKSLRSFIREFDPIIIGVDDAADTLVELGYKPHLIVGNPSNIASETLRCGAHVVLPADPDGHAAGLERIQDLGVGAMTFPAATDSATDLALLLANYHEAEMIVKVGDPVDLDAIFTHQPHATPAALLTRVKTSSKLIDATTVANLYRVQSGGGLAWMWAILGVLIALAVVVVIAGTAGPGSFSDNLIDTWNNIALTVQGWFH